MRTLSTVQTIRAVTPVPGFDRIELATVLGYQAWVAKGKVSPGDRVVYVEVDTFMPDGHPLFTHIDRKTTTYLVGTATVSGGPLRPAKFRGVTGLGLVFTMQEMADAGFPVDPSAPVGTCLDKQLGLVVYRSEQDLLGASLAGGGVIGDFDERLFPKTDAMRLERLVDDMAVINQFDWVPTIKMDGTSISISVDGGQVRVFGRNKEYGQDAPALIWAKQVGIVDALQAVGEPVGVQFEWVGPKIQTNSLGLGAPEGRLFTLWKRRVKVPYTDWPEELVRFRVPCLNPTVFSIDQSIDALQKRVDALEIGPGRPHEGVVWHTWESDFRLTKLVGESLAIKLLATPFK